LKIPGNPKVVAFKTTHVWQTTIKHKRQFSIIITAGKMQCTSQNKNKMREQSKIGN
jgi:hypothetical protein